MEVYHHAWLKAHPDRSLEWLEERLKDGFDVHHLDNDHQNNEPLNLALIEHVDHVRLFHGFPGNRVRASEISRRRGIERRAARAVEAAAAKERAKAAVVAQQQEATKLLKHVPHEWVRAKKEARREKLAAMVFD